MWPVAIASDTIGIDTVRAPRVLGCLAGRCPAVGKRRLVSHTDEIARMNERQTPQEPEELTRFGLVLNSKAYSQSLPVTVWDKLRDADRQSVEYFAVRYATPIYCYYRRKWRLAPDEAKDLTMGFIAEKLVAGGLLKKFRPGQRRFRAYLLRALRNYFIDARRKKDKLRMLQLDQVMEESPDAEPRIDDPAEKEFVRNCTHDQLRAALLRVREGCLGDGLEEHLQLFFLRHFTDSRPGWDEIGRRFGIGWQEAKNKAWTVKERLRKAVLAEFRIAGLNDSQARDEIRSLMGLFQESTGEDFSLTEGGQ